MPLLIRSFAAVLLLGLPSALHADVRLPSIIGDNMVLQRGRELPIWGWAEPGEQVTVMIGESTADGTAGDDGKWSVKLPAVEKTGPISVSVAGSNRIELQNVIVGEVWICSGQSNMGFTVARSKDAEQEIAAADFPSIRLFKAANKQADTPQDDVPGSWVECSPATVGTFSGVGYFFGRDLHRALNEPVGLVQSAWGGTPAEAWTTQQTLAGNPNFQPILDRWAAAGDDDPIWKRKHRAPYRLYNAMIAPLQPFAMKGAIWYQGEGNSTRAAQYRTLFPAMINDWRRTWGQGDFPFLFVQLANFRARAAQPGDSTWAELREAQSMTLSLPNTAQAVAIDVGEADDIHPTNKQDVGRRLSLAARATVYGEDVVYSGPTLRSLTIEQSKIRVHFSDIADGLVAHGGVVKGFSIAGVDREFHWASAEIDGDTVVLSAPEVDLPIAVRYGWADNPECTLYNSAGLPASPFRTDDWPGVTDGKLIP